MKGTEMGFLEQAAQEGCKWDEKTERALELACQRIAELEAERDEARRERDESVALLRKARSTIGAAGWYVSTQLAKESSVLNDSISDFLLRRAQQRYRASLRRQAQGGE